jgi:hypothetical protein
MSDSEVAKSVVLVLVPCRKMVCYDWWLEHVSNHTTTKCTEKCPKNDWVTESCHKVCHHTNTITKKVNRNVAKVEPMSPNKSLLTLPTLDGKYKRNYECVWYACSVKEEPYHLELTEFDLEYSTTTAGKCLKDWLEIRKGGQNGLLEGKLCGRLAGERQYTINDQCLWLRFRSDGGHQRKGFNGWFALRSELIDISSKNSGTGSLFCKN